MNSELQTVKLVSLGYFKTKNKQELVELLTLIS